MLKESSYFSKQIFHTLLMVRIYYYTDVLYWSRTRVSISMKFYKIFGVCHEQQKQPRSSHQRCSTKKGVLKNFNTTFFTEHLRTTASGKTDIIQEILTIPSQCLNQLIFSKFLYKEILRIEQSPHFEVSHI